MARIAFLCSGGGGNLRLLHALCVGGVFGDTAVTTVIGDRQGTALDWARSQGLQAQVLGYTRAQPQALHEALRQAAPDLVVTTIHKILDDELVARYTGRLLNLHYSLLPAFAGSIGMETVRLARRQGCRLIGATAHRVTAELDAGPILAQSAISDDGAPEPVLFDAVFRAGGVALAAAVQSLLDPASVQAGGWVDAGGTAVFAGPRPGPATCAALQSPDFWQRLR